MKKISILLALVLAPLAACDPSGAARPTAVADAPAARAPDRARGGLERAHAAWAAGRPRDMTRELLAVLASPDTDDDARTNAIELADRAFADGRGALDTGFTLPAGITWMRLVFQHAENDGAPTYRALLNGGVAPGVEIASLDIVRLRDGRVLASKSGLLGDFAVGPDGEGRPYFYIQTPGGAARLESGAYRIAWAYADGRSGAADIVVPTVQLDAVPEILEPAYGAVAASATPTVRWKAPAWVDETSFGRIILEAHAGSKAGYTVKERWSMWESSPTRTELVIGAVGTPEGVRLDEGSYDLAVQYEWRLQYGELQLGGSTRAAHPFSVAAAR